MTINSRFQSLAKLNNHLQNLQFGTLQGEGVAFHSCESNGAILHSPIFWLDLVSAIRHLGQACTVKRDNKQDPPEWETTPLLVVVLPSELDKVPHRWNTRCWKYIFMRLMNFSKKIFCLVKVIQFFKHNLSTSWTHDQHVSSLKAIVTTCSQKPLCMLELHREINTRFPYGKQL